MGFRQGTVSYARWPDILTISRLLRCPRPRVEEIGVTIGALVSRFPVRAGGRTGSGNEDETGMRRQFRAFDVGAVRIAATGHRGEGHRRIGEGPGEST